MHIIFIPYGKRSEVELLLRDMDAQKHMQKVWKGKEEKGRYIQGQVRLLPLGVYEYVCPKEDLDRVLTTLRFHEKAPYNLGKTTMMLLRKMTRAKKIPEFSTEFNYLWILPNVAIIPIGIREDEDYTEKEGDLKGWSHEGI